MTDDTFTEKDLSQAEQYENLGPQYFMARRVVEKAMQDFEDDMLKPIIEKAAQAFQDELWDKVRDTIWADTEYNLQGAMWRGVGQIIEGLLGGNDWALKQYVTGPGYDAQKIRTALVRLVPDEIQNAALQDALKEIDRLKKDLEWYRSR